MSNKITIPKVFDLDKQDIQQLSGILRSLGIHTNYIIDQELNRCLIYDASGVKSSIIRSRPDDAYHYIPTMKAWYIKQIKKAVKEKK